MGHRKKVDIEMAIFSSRPSNIEALQGQLFDNIVKCFAKENDVPMMASGGYAVLEEIELAVESLLLRPSISNLDLSPEIAAMAEMWRKLERDAKSRRPPIRWDMLSPQLPMPMMAV